MIKEFATELAEQSGIQLSRVSVVEGRRIGCLDVHLLHLGSDGQLVSALVYQSELDELHSSSCCERLEMKIRSALSRLQMQLNP
jgi:hypothetical protein